MEAKDHDMLIKLDTKMSIMCNTLTKMTVDNEKQHKEIYDLIDMKMNITNDKLDNKVDFKYFKWLIGIVVGFMIIFGSTGVNHINNSNLEHNVLQGAVQHLIDDSPHNIVLPKE